MVETKQQVLIRKKQVGQGITIALLLLDCAGRVNVLTNTVVDELQAAFNEIKSDKSISALVILSGKADNFCSGADLHEIRRVTSKEQAYEKSKQGQEILNNLRHMKKPAIAAINGACLGGGLELALCAHRRIATNSATTTFGLPEVRLGLIPGLGGTQRLPRLVGLKAALEIILSSELIDAKRALEIGLVDELVSADNLIARAEELAVQMVKKQREDSAGELLSLVDKTEGPITDMDPSKQTSLFAMMDRSVRIKTKGNYPAHTQVLQVMKVGLEEGIEQGLEKEAQVFGELAISEVSHNLISVFLTSEFARQSALAFANRNGGKGIQCIAIIGGGVMGVSIAQLAAANGLRVLLKEVNEEKLNEANERLTNLINRQGQKSKQDPATIAATLARVIPIVDEKMLEQADLILEAAFENLEVKKKIFTDIAKHARPDCLLATNTSSLSITSIAEVIPNNERFIGMHFFHPVDRMPLVELITHEATSRDTNAKASSFVSRLGKTAISVKDGHGFLVNRLLCCYLADAAYLAELEIPLNWIDETAIAFGMPMGPFELLDEVGMDIAFAVARVVHKGCGDRLTPPALLNKMEARGLVGKKTGAGFYAWDAAGKRHGFTSALTNELHLKVAEGKSDHVTKTLILDRLLLPMIDEAAHCLEEKIIIRPREVDLSMILGVGFPPFRGGLLRYADSMGMSNLVNRLKHVYAQAGPPRKISNLISKMEAEGRSFYSRGTGSD
jgi:3-hydroxyacyl-CoA dehydrogenase/enoyl-CoA hydratase/3-hydroxybutyryl-CoA epimerase